MLRRLLTRLRLGFCLREEFQPGLFLRIAKAQRWQSDESANLPTVESAIRDLKLRPEENGLSLYRLHKEDEADQLACVYSLTLRDNPAHFEYVLFPAEVLSGYSVNPVPLPEHPQFLSQRHYEIFEPSEE